MAQILSLVQDNTEKIKEIIEDDIWGSIKEFLNWGIHVGEGDKAIDVTVGLLLLITIAFIITSFVIEMDAQFFTRNMETRG